MAAPKRTYGTTAQRPTGMLVTDTGFQYFDTDLSRPILWNGYNWVDSEGAGV